MSDSPLPHRPTPPSGLTSPLPRVTAPDFAKLKSSGAKITMVTAYDYAMGRLVDEAGVEGVLVGDSLGMVVQGRESTLPVTLDQMIYHAEMVGRAVQRALVVVDLPFPMCSLGPLRAIEGAGRILKETRCQAVKLEGGIEQSATIAALAGAGIPVMAHCGLRPQSVHQLGGYRVQRDVDSLLRDARAAAEAGAFAVVLECVPAHVARTITDAISIPTIGIGAGRHCDGQVLVLHDILGLNAGPAPRFVKTYERVGAAVTAAVSRFRQEVRGGDFPKAEHEYH